jgi:hypothetical protein
MKKLLIKACGTTMLVCLLLPCLAQMPDDGFTMGKGELCIVAGYKQSQWKEYWEGKRLRENLNMGTFTSKAFMPMLGYGVTDKLNLFASLPYISNSSDKGTMTGKKGWQDFSFAAKYQVLDIKKKNFRYALFGTAAFSLPATNYVPDFLPYSIGIGSQTASLRVIGHVVFKEDFFATIQTGYTFRSNITVDRITYYTDGQHYTDEMKIPDIWDGSVKLGYDNYRIRTNVHYMIANSTSGSDMRLNDMPYPGNKMDMQAIGVDVLLWVPKVKGLGLTGSADKTIAGRNMGKAFTWMAGAQYVFKPFQKKPKKEAAK